MEDIYITDKIDYIKRVYSKIIVGLKFNRFDFETYIHGGPLSYFYIKWEESAEFTCGGF
jgi:hypothetical protein